MKFFEQAKTLLETEACDYTFYGGKDESRIVAAEKTLNVRFPESYKAF